MDFQGKCDILHNILFSLQIDNYPPLPPNFVKYHTTPTCHYTPVTLVVVNNMILHLNYASSSGHDGISDRVIAQFHNALPSVLHNLFDTLFCHSGFPNTWKEACCIVIPKPGKASYTIPKSSCPISLLPYLSKVFERLAANRIT
jgi:hypothetical protein